MTASLPTFAQAELASLDADALVRLLIRNEDRVPVNVIDECAQRGHEMVELLAALLHKDYYWSEDRTDGEWWLLVHAPMILGRMADARAAEVLVAFMRRIDESDDENLQEWLGGYWPAFFLNKPDGFLESLRALADDPRSAWYMRSEATAAAIAYAQSKNPQALESELAWAGRIAFDKHEDLDLRVTIGCMLLDFAPAAFRRPLEQLADLQRETSIVFDRKEIAQVYFARGRAPQWQWDAFKDPWRFYEPEAIEARQREWAKADAEIESELPMTDEPYVRGAEKVGRNDPCPCGSGKKYKKCCLEN